MWRFSSTSVTRSQVKFSTSNLPTCFSGRISKFRRNPAEVRQCGCRTTQIHGSTTEKSNLRHFCGTGVSQLQLLPATIAPRKDLAKGSKLLWLSTQLLWELFYGSSWVNIKRMNSTWETGKRGRGRVCAKNAEMQEVPRYSPRKPSYSRWSGRSFCLKNDCDVRTSRVCTELRTTPMTIS